MRFHRRISPLIRNLFPENLTQMIPSYSWQIVFGPLFLGMGILMLYVIKRDMVGVRNRLLFILALGCFVSAVGLDFVEGLKSYSIADSMRLSVNYVLERRHLFQLMEESLEIIGAILALECGCRLLARENAVVQIKF